ncbi:MAG: PQQ-binding-like beta-propeller repeat protein, partial [Treponema sp.]|nr:PQQ-binding-like beta-propeller repeat protein [Candidatus Treponema equifaecale]
VDLIKTKPSLQTVIGGDAVSPCVETSYGIAVISDGRLLSACTNNGNVIWQRTINGKPSPYLSSFGDFLYVVTDNSKLNFMNPSGATVWSVNCPFTITQAPLSGLDGRVYVRGEKSIACYGLNGTRKWKQDSQKFSKIPMSMLPDGSVIAYLAEAKNGHTVAKRFSAFGEELEDLTFAEIVVAAHTCKEGVLISLKGGSIGMVTVQGEKADSKWVTASGNGNGAFAITYREATNHAAYFFQKGKDTIAMIVNVRDGKILNQFVVGHINTPDFKGARATNSGFFISGAISACEFYEDGTILWSAVLPPKNKWKELFYTRSNFLIFCMKDWSMNFYKMTQAPGDFDFDTKMETKSLIKTKEMDSVSKQFNLHFLNSEKISEINENFKKGDYSILEEDYLISIKSEAQAYIDSLNSQSSFRNEAGLYKEDPVFTENLMQLMANAGTSDFSSLFARILTTETDSALLSCAITYSGAEGFDPKGEILRSYEYLISGKILPRDASIIKNICDSTYKIYAFMGRPSFNKQGKNILTRLMYPQYDKPTRDYARATLEKMVGLEK